MSRHEPFPLFQDEKEVLVELHRGSFDLGLKDEMSVLSAFYRLFPVVFSNFDEFAGFDRYGGKLRRSHRGFILILCDLRFVVARTILVAGCRFVLVPDRREDLLALFFDLRDFRLRETFGRGGFCLKDQDACQDRDSDAEGSDKETVSMVFFGFIICWILVSKWEVFSTMPACIGARKPVSFLFALLTSEIRAEA
jgi:hypothetical protein